MVAIKKRSCLLAVFCSSLQMMGGFGKFENMYEHGKGLVKKYGGGVGGAEQLEMWQITHP